MKPFLFTLLVLCQSTWAEPYAMDQFRVNECRGNPSWAEPGQEPCYWYLKQNLSQCRLGAKCDKLVLFFSGGEMRCDEDFAIPQGYDHTLSRFAADGYVAVCAGLFLEGQNKWTTIPPYHRMASRVDVLVRNILNSPRIKSIWSGKSLLISGVSHGATAPVIAMARSGFDLNWKGSQKTAACFYDGIYDVPTMDSFWRNNEGCESFRDRGVCIRYLGPGNENCNYPIATTTDTSQDSVTTVSASALAIKKWKLIECGSAVQGEKCPRFLNGDVVPQDPIQNLCQSINKEGAAGYSCLYDPLPESGHVACSSDDIGIDKCRLWFNSL